MFPRGILHFDRKLYGLFEFQFLILKKKCSGENFVKTNSSHLSVTICYLYEGVLFKRANTVISETIRDKMSIKLDKICAHIG